MEESGAGGGSSTAARSSATSGVASRGRGRGRPPKIPPTAGSLPSTPVSTPRRATTPASPSPSPTPSPSVTSPLSPSSLEDGDSTCRRSSRKKVIKFDVRDLLNKNRKAHKIQIEARIDSNSSCPTNPIASPSGAAPPVNRVFSMFESNKLMPPKPPPTALGMFAKPRPTQSLIVAQVTSEPSSTAVPVVPTPPVRKRGRPRKIRPAEQQAPLPITSDSDTTTSTGSGGDSGDLIAAALDPAKRKLRVSLKRLNLSRRLESTDSGEMPLSIRLLGAGGNSSSSSPSTLSLSAPIIQDENALDEQPKPLPKEPVTSVISVPDENTDSDSQIIFIEIETAGKEEDTANQEAGAREGIQVLMPESGADQDSDEMMVEVLSGPPSLWSADDEAEEEEEVAPRAEPVDPDTESLSAAPRRSRRSVRGGSNSHQGKTLEETFANIAAESSKQILEQEQEEHLLIDLIEDSQSQPEDSGTERINPDTALESALVKLEPTLPEDNDPPEGTSQIVVRLKKYKPTTPEIMKELENETETETVQWPKKKLPSEEPEAVPVEATAAAEPHATSTSAEETKPMTKAAEAKAETSETSPDGPDDGKPATQNRIIKSESESASIALVDDTTRRLEADRSKQTGAKVAQMAGPGPSDTVGSTAEGPLGDQVAVAISEKSPEKVEAKAEAGVERTEVEVESKPKRETETATEAEAKTDAITLKTEPAKSEEKSPAESESEPDKPKALPQKASRMPLEWRKVSPKSSGTEESQPGKSIKKEKEEKKDKEATRKEKPKDRSRKNSASKKDSDSEKSLPERKSSPEATSKKEAASSAAEPPEENSKKSKEKSTVFVESDAMFKAMDKANAHLRQKKVKKAVPAPPQPQPQPHPKAAKASSASSSAAQPKKMQTKSLLKPRRNTMFAEGAALWSAMAKRDRNSSPGDSDSSWVATPKPKKNRAKKKAGYTRRSTISEEAKHLGSKAIPIVDLTGGSSPISTSSDASSKKARSKRSTPELVRATTLSKLEQRRNTICEDRRPVVKVKAAVPITKRRYSVHPKATAHPPQPEEASKPAPKKRGRKPGKAAMSRQNSLDSSSSASLAGGATASKRKAQKSTDALQAALTETESSESTSSGSKMRRCNVQISPELEAPDPLKDIAKFIEDGVNLLKRDYKLDEEQKAEQPGEATKAEQPEDEFAQRVANIETPATTPSPSPTEESSNASGTQLQEGNGGVRRSHRIKKKPQGFKAGQARGVTSTSTALTPLSMDEQLTELANIEAINEQFLRSEGLNTFQPLRENYYRCARQVSQENAEMQCDCFLTGDEDAQGHLCCGSGCINRMLMIECGPLCSNGDRCTNKRFQQHQCWPCRVFRTEKKGCGITAELQIPPGEFIMEYVGEVIDSEEFERRQHLYSRDRKRHYYFMALRGEAIIDATSKGNISRYINHSCDPNAETQKWTVNGELRIGFFSVKTIQPGEEITFDYQYQRYGRDAQRCYCEAANCRGWIGGEPDSDEGEQLDVSSESDVEEEEEIEADAATEEVEPKAPKVKAKGAKIKGKQATAKPGKRKEQPKSKDREYKAGRWLKPSGGAGASGSGEKVARAKPKVSKFHAMLEDPDVVEELSRLSRSGLKNQLDTLRFSRCMVRAKLLQTRLQLLGVLTRGELPCRRLFLDYHGLRLLHAWISESGSDSQLRMALLEALESLPIPNRTMLNDSKIYQSVQLWSNSLGDPQVGAGGDASQPALSSRMTALLKKWQALPEIFRIPKRERIEQMKEHEREADRPQKPLFHSSTGLEDLRERDDGSSADPYRQDRFRGQRDNTNNRNNKPTRMSGNNTICTITTQQKGNNGAMEGINRMDNRRRSDLGPTIGGEARRAPLSKELRRSLFERKVSIGRAGAGGGVASLTSVKPPPTPQVALDEAEKRVCTEDWREHEARCEFFGADLGTDPKLLPFYQNTETGEWFNSEDMPLPAPQRTDAQAQAMLSPESDGAPTTSAGAAEYKLPAGVDPLPPSWHWRLTSDGDIYYYNLRDRICQWEPPSPEQRLQTLIDTEDPTKQPPLQELQIDTASELIQVDVDYVGSLSNKSLAQYVEGKVKERREMRRNRLVSVCLISPRRDEDRLYNQLESRKYKENKEKIRRRKELYRRRRLDAAIAGPGGSGNTDGTSPNNSLPIQGYLYSSDEDASTDAPVVELPLIDGIVAGGMQVDELDALNMEPSTSQAAAAAAALASLIKLPGPLEEVASPIQVLGSKRKLPMPPHITDFKRQRSAPDQRIKKSKTTMLSNVVIGGREAHGKFRSEISGHVAEFLRPYRKDTCPLGRITSEEDFNFLIKRLTHHITTKEMRYCDMTGNPLACTESVKHKSYDFINQYMRKKGRVYKRPADETIF
ncbi:hypothetical protein KR074_004652 [Drosophila pseudoananassae]|nr:hypothetical protein KR074_004652 [Drosophila pseudoananassae]